jgi:hypothetical protein
MKLNVKAFKSNFLSENIIGIATLNPDRQAYIDFIDKNGKEIPEDDFQNEKKSLMVSIKSWAKIQKYELILI